MNLHQSDYEPLGHQWHLYHVRQSHRRRLIHRILTGIVQVAILVALGALFGLAIIDAIVTGPPVPLP